MSQKVTIGGDRVGSGKKMQAELHDYYRSTHNLSEKWASSMASGVLYPAMCKLAMRGDSFDINIAADARTIPTVGPLFGSFKMQIDVYQCPIRLYQGILHNNPLAIGLNMAQVKFPTLHVWTVAPANDMHDEGKLSDSCLLKYLGLSGLGHAGQDQSNSTFGRVINALPALSYYDIFKTYYANKQEENAYIITPSDIRKKITNAKKVIVRYKGYDDELHIWYDEFNIDQTFPAWTTNAYIEEIKITGENIANYYDKLNLSLSVDGATASKHNMEYWNDDDLFENIVVNQNEATYYINKRTLENFDAENDITFKIENIHEDTYESNIKLQDFKLSNIDDMRYDLLGHHTLGTAFEIKPGMNNPYLPYSALIEVDNTSGLSWNKFAMNGLVLKTYQNDMFNNWLNTEWIEGENGINELTKVAVVNGAFSMDALNMSMKLYNMLNRIALAGGTYEDWQDVVYEEVQRRQIESPIYIGGMSQEIMFDEIVQTAPTDGNPLGTLGGRGRLVGNKKGGRIHVKCDEACFIIAIVSLTPRLFYTQGNEFYMTDIFSMDDLHKPAMDGIGFQDLIAERMAYFDTVIQPNTTNVLHRSKIGKLPAWIEYMTSYDRAYGDFAGEYGKGFMILNRNYEQAELGGIKDATTYIDPSKYNYAFAVQELAAQNFWVQINFDIKARRLMSARLIPNV